MSIFILPNLSHFSTGLTRGRAKFVFPSYFFIFMRDIS
ncbi:hypothetical protein B4064_1406 [Caldibacillus thermoamylovorans]|uniref:Uncharacterized protein n=1 Tax=Caldibacillus thermoamylovorans TaxID=35841 RepID=A0ABD4A6H7_9BACI|nr:hypothetical protein B4166_1125 [Caldibacillus thermoamylovorans]KIO69073.1 hypothetical protein B4064_1406 [Caldibacillus thermoamylovorans]KIO72537.1 hypothetical protein B4167_1227 [Caldibacillus thermoamylovorans]